MSAKKISLKSIAIPNGISSGYSFRGKIEHIPDGDLRVVQLKDMENEYSSIGDECTFVDGNDIKEKYYLQNGDILFISKGANNFALVYELEDGISTVASSVFYVIKIDTALADPHYIAWLINGEHTQQYFQTNATGTYSLNINRKVVEEIPITLPPLKVQKKIAKISKLAQREQFIYTLLKEKRNQLIEAQLLKAII